MLFYKVQGTIVNPPSEEPDARQARKFARRIMEKTVAFKPTGEDKQFYFLSDYSSESVTVGVISHSAKHIEKTAAKFLNAIGLASKEISATEITFDALKWMLNDADHSSFINESEYVLEQFGLDKLERMSFNYGENIIQERDKDTLTRLASGYLMNETLMPELDRIYMGKTKSKAMGHPVHYLVQTDDKDNRREICRLLLSALYANGRLESRRYVFIDIRPKGKLNPIIYDTLYNSCKGGTFIVRYLANDDTLSGDLASGESDCMEIIAETARRYRNDVLTIFCLPRASEKSKATLFDGLGSTSVVEIKEDLVSNESARQYLKALAKEAHVRTDSRLLEKVEEDRTYIATDLKYIFDEWYNGKLRKTTYPQYSEINPVSHSVVKAKPKGSAYSELSEMVGLTEAKALIDKAVGYYKMQRLYSEKGIKEDHPAMHMIFTGNPGTAKTTVARLFARIMRENKLISKGHLVEVGRGDLIGKYVGWTAQNVQAKFKAAKGGVLFIDEAYSLVDDRDGSFGDEAINTIVQEMENNREDVVVIFAGYPDKMEQFLQKNPGLRSRIAFHVPFADYNADELCQIAQLIGRSKGMHIDDGAMDKLRDLFEIARAQTDFGNGRYARNIFEQSKMNLASRLLERDFDTITESDMLTITAEDIAVPCSASSCEKPKIGFC